MHGVLTRARKASGLSSHEFVNGAGMAYVLVSALKSFYLFIQHLQECQFLTDLCNMMTWGWLPQNNHVFLFDDGNLNI